MLSRLAYPVFLLAAANAAPPTLLEEGQQITLFAESPDIVTPIGMAIGSNDRVFVIESHTHSPPSNYAGPESDLIKVFIDEDNDGRADSFTVFADGLDEAMNLAFSPDGTLYALCANALVALPDRDQDGVCDGLETILTLETESSNPHGNWLGFDFDAQGKVYLGRGNVGSYYHKVEGKDGSVVEGYGDGGNIVRANADGTEVEEWATGFWNPMDLKFDRKGRLMLVDNDPDARGPNRLLEVVEGGDYGYKSVFGGSGRHPFQGWDGSLPGTLPFLSGTGEAPSGLIDASHSNKDSYLVTIWNENTIERHTVLDDGVQKTLFAKGGKNFRPVALAFDSRDNLFITDWMLVDYPNHGEGSIWRVSPLKKPAPRTIGKSPPQPNARSIRKILTSDDPFERHAGELWLSRTPQASLAARLSSDNDPLVRLGAALAMRRSNRPDQTERIQSLLADSDLSVRRIALMWAGETLNLELRPQLDKALAAGEVNRTLFEAYLAAVEMLEPDFAETFGSRLSPRANRIPRSLDPSLLAQLARDTSLPATARALAIARLSPEDCLDLLDHADPEIRLAALKNAARTSGNTVRDRIRRIAFDTRERVEIRAEALFGLGRQSLENPQFLVPLMDDPNTTIAIEAARTLRLHSGNEAVRTAFGQRYPDWSSVTGNPALGELAEAALYGFDPRKSFAQNRPQDVDTWKERLARGGDPDRGSRVFRSPRMLCASCHSSDGSGNEFGPDLSGIAQSIDRGGIIHAILRPSDSFSPDFQAWTIKTKDGQSHQGVQIDHKSKGDILLYTTDARENELFKAEDILDYGASPYSLMPPGLENTMTVSEFRDLIAYLASLN